MSQLSEITKASFLQDNFPILQRLHQNRLDNGPEVAMEPELNMNATKIAGFASRHPILRTSAGPINEIVLRDRRELPKRTDDSHMLMNTEAANFATAYIGFQIVATCGQLRKIAPNEPCGRERGGEAQ